MVDTNKRTHTRAQYFLIKDEGQAVPIYAFRDPADVLAIPALVVNLGDGGVQVLTTHTAYVSQEIYNLELVAENPDDAKPEIAQVHRVWSREDGVNVRTGFAFSQGANVGARWLKILEGAPHHLLRCILHPVRQTNS
jgi:hypothetical protein